MNTLTPKQIEDLLNIGYSIKTDEKSLQIQREVLYSLISKVYQLGFKKGSDHDIGRST